MMLVLGVNNVAYSDPDDKSLTTTGEVAGVLEAQYGVMQTFYDLHKNEIAEAIKQRMMGQIESAITGSPHSRKNLRLEGVARLFRTYLSQDEWQKSTGRKIQAAQDGVSHRFKDVYNRQGKRGSRPAFIDSGLYRRSFRADLET